MTIFKYDFDQKFKIKFSHFQSFYADTKQSKHAVFVGYFYPRSNTKNNDIDPNLIKPQSAFSISLADDCASVHGEYIVGNTNGENVKIKE